MLTAGDLRTRSRRDLPMPKPDNAYDRYDPYDATATAEQIRDQYGEMRERGPVVHVPRHGGFEVVTHYDAVRSTAADPETFSSAEGSFILPSGFPPIPPLDFDEPEHRRWVKLMQGPLTLESVTRIEPMIADVVTEHVERFATRGSAELYEEFAEPVPAHVIGRLVGLSPEGAARMRRVGMNVFGSIGTEDFPKRMQEFTEFTTAELEARRRNPLDDYLTKLSSGELDGEKVDDVGCAGLLVSLLVGGHHSTASALAGLVHHTLTIPGLRDRLRDADADLVKRVVEESLRLSTPLQYFTRTAVRDTEIAGCPIPAGRRVALNYAAANRDERAFREPGTFDADRERNRHLAFGHGIHLCIGRYLARAELRIALTELLRRLPDIELAGQPVEPGYIGSMLISIVSLPVRFSPSP
jgi:cytochrome P450